MNRRRTRRSAVLCALLAAASCAVGPDYVPPALALPTNFSVDAAHPTSDTAPEPAEKPPEPASDLSQWWRTFGDPVLDGLIERAIANSSDLRAEAARVREARALRGVVASEQGPSIEANGSYERRRRAENAGNAGTNPFTIDRETGLYDVGFDATFELDLFGRVRRSVEAADADLAAVDAAYVDVRLTLAAEVARNYVEMRAAQQRRVVVERNLASQRDGIAIAQARFEAGIESELAVTQARAQVAASEATLPALERLAEQARFRIAVLLDADPRALPAPLAATAALPLSPPAIPVGLPSELLTRRPDLRRAERTLAAATARIGVATADLYPRFTLNGSVGLQSTQFSDLTEPGSGAWTFGPAFSWPIFVSGRIRQGILAQDARAEAALAQYEGAVIGAVVEVEDALSGVGREKERRGALGAAVAASQRSVDLSRELYTRGLVDYLNVLDGEQRLLSAQEQAVGAQAAELTSVIALLKALGGGWDAEPPAERPEEHVVEQG